MSKNTTYVKLQDAYIAEVGIAIGSWKTIGYNMPSSSNFDYYDGSTKGINATASTVSLTAGLAPAWQAINVATLNDCAANSKWQLDVSQNGSTGGSATYEAKITGGAGGDCEMLTPNFKALDSKDKTVSAAN